MDYRVPFFHPPEDADAFEVPLLLRLQRLPRRCRVAEMCLAALGRSALHEEHGDRRRDLFKVKISVPADVLEGRLPRALGLLGGRALGPAVGSLRIVWLPVRRVGARLELAAAVHAALPPRRRRVRLRFRPLARGAERALDVGHREHGRRLVLHHPERREALTQLSVHLCAAPVAEGQDEVAPVAGAVVRGVRDDVAEMVREPLEPREAKALRSRRVCVSPERTAHARRR